MKKLLTLLLFLSMGSLHAQDIFQEYLFSADFVMQNREKINLTDAQAEKIKKIHSTNAAEFTTLKWDLDAASEKLKKLIAEPKPNPDLVTKQMDLVLSMENQLKKKQLSTLVAIKNELTESQQATLFSNRKITVVGKSLFPSGGSYSQSISGSGYKYGFDASGMASSSSSEPLKGLTGTSSLAQESGSRVMVQLDQGGKADQVRYFIKKEDGLVEVFDIEKIKPEQIESIEVLKGDTAIVRMGEKGKNGVIIFTLKKSGKNNLYFQQEK